LTTNPWRRWRARRIFQIAASARSILASSASAVPIDH
jgi:hypothetical protein